MKHNTHIYIASKATEFLRDSVNNLHTRTGRMASAKTQRKVKTRAKELQHLLRYHAQDMAEASWAPDDILCDKALYHTFKLFTDNEFPRGRRYARETHNVSGVDYHRISGGGGLPYKVDHLARTIADMQKLREYNDQFSQKQIMYLLFLISHYVVDAHVPMHCDIRDDPPSKKDKTKPPGKKKYYSDALHGEIERIWDAAVTPVAMEQGIVVADTYKDCKAETDLSPCVRFDVGNRRHRDLITPTNIPNRGLMNHMISVCVRSKERSLQLFPVGNPGSWRKDLLGELTREIFADAIGGVVGVWLWIWGRS